MSHPFSLRPRSLLRHFLMLLPVILTLAGLTLLLRSEQPFLARAAGDDLLTLDWTSAEAVWTFDVAWVDIDGDGDLDLATCDLSALRVYRNDNGILTTSAAWVLYHGRDDPRMAWGDYDNDGDLDLAMGLTRGGPVALYHNDGSAINPSPVWLSVENNQAYSLAWGDVDGDRDLDLAVGNGNQPNRIYRNDGLVGGIPQMTLAWSAAITDTTSSVAWADMDSDGDLDLAVGNSGQPNRVYRNDGLAGADLQMTLAWSAAMTESTLSVAWGDVDGDGDPDLAVGNWNRPAKLYLNDGTSLNTTWDWESDENGCAGDIAWGDADSDGDLDLAVATCDYPFARSNRLYLNSGTGLSTSADWYSLEQDDSGSVAWGDMDNDGDLDLAIGNAGHVGQPNRVYRNNGGTLPSSAGWSTPIGEGTTSLAWGDVDNDGNLDLAVGNYGQPNRLYRNDGGILTNVNAWISAESDNTSSIAWGDMDGDGDLDLAVGNHGQPSRLYRNDEGILTSSAVYSTPFSDLTNTIAWGDVDGDGDLDLAVGNGAWYQGQPNRLYRNDGMVNGIPVMTLIWSSAESDDTRSLAWGDYDNDGDLDLAAGNEYIGVNRIYRNDGGTLTQQAVWSAIDGGDETHSIAWGDYDNDGDLDLAVGNEYQLNRIYHNEGGTINPRPVWSSNEIGGGESVAWGDVDNDGDLDLAMGVCCNALSRLYLNDQGVFSANANWFSTESGNVRSVAWGDVDNDGDLDLAVSNEGFSRLYINQRDRQALPGSIPVVSVSHPGPQANFYAMADIQSGVIPISYTLTSPQNDLVLAVRAWYSLNGGGQWLPAVAASGTITTNLPAWGKALAFDGLDDSVTVANSPAPLGNSAYTIAAWIKPDTMGGRTIAGWGNYGVTNQANGLRLTDTGLVNYWWENDLVVTTGVITGTWRHVAATYDGVIRTIYLDGAPIGSDNPTGHDVPTNANFSIGAGDNLEFFDGAMKEVNIWSRALTPAEIQSCMVHGLHGDETGLAAYFPLGEGDGLIAYDYSANHQNGILINNPAWDDTVSQYIFYWDVNASGFFGKSDNVVFRMQAVPGIANHPNGIPGPYLYGSYASSTFPFRVRGTQMRVFEEVVAPGSEAQGALVYRLPADDFFGALPLSNAAGKPFLTDSLGFLQGRGQIDLGDRLVALLPISATETYTLYYTSAPPSLTGLIPYTVTAGGVQTLTVSANNALVLFNLELALEWDARQDTEFMSQLAYGLQRASELLYDWSNGQAALGQVQVFHNRQRWNEADIRIYATNHRRPSATLGGIVSFDLTDPVTTTLVYMPGMVHIGAVWNRYGDPGNDLGEDWPRALAHELGHYALFLDDDYLGLDEAGQLITIDTCTGTAMTDPYRDDYSEFKHTADWLPGCEDTLANRLTGRSDWATLTTFYPALDGLSINDGPSAMPLALTEIITIALPTPPQALADPRFYLKDEDGGSLLPGSSARAFLFRDDILIDLGSPAVDTILARGAQPDDRLCLIDLAAARSGCKTILPGDNQQLTLFALSDWQPQVRITPVTTRTVEVTLNGLAPDLSLLARLYSGDGLASQTIALSLSGSDYSGVFALASPTADGYVRIWVDQPDTSREVVADYAMGGSPARQRSGYARQRSGYAPAMSSDGQVLLYSEDIAFPLNEFYTLQAATLIPSPPHWATVVGRAYWLSHSSGAPSLSGTSLSMGYLESEVPAGEESWLRIYRWDGSAWTPLVTTVNAYENNTVAPIDDIGLYVLMSTIEIPLYGPGWDLFAYPVQATRPVTEALQSVDGFYSTVYWFDGSDSADPWKVYDIGAPGWVNDLTDLQFGESYWISLTQSITLYLKGGGGILAAPLDFEPVPATYYGQVLATGAGRPPFTPEVGQIVTARIEGQWCGQTQIQWVNGEFVYAVNVLADGPGGLTGCGEPGKQVIFEIDATPMQPQALWDSDRVHELDLQANSPPIAVDDSFTTDEDTLLVVIAPGVLANDSDPNGDALTATLFTAPGHGLVDLQADGALIYTPTLDYNGTDSFSYRASDGLADSNLASVLITVTAVNDPPIANDDAVSTIEDTAIVIPVLNNDTDVDGDVLSVITLTLPAHGSAVTNGTLVTYTPATDYYGPDEFTYAASDGSLSDTAEVYITVLPYNDAPVANDDFYTTSEDTLLITPAATGLLLNDVDADGDALSANLVTSPTHGSLSLDLDGSFVYQPNSNFNGSDNFTYRANDGTSDSNLATVTLSITPVNDAPVAFDDTAMTVENTPIAIPVLNNDIDVDGDTLSVITVTLPAHGSVVTNGTLITYTPAADTLGSDSFTYIASDGALDSNPAMVTLTIVASEKQKVYLPLVMRTSEVRTGTESDDHPISLAGVAEAVLLLGVMWIPSKKFHRK